MNKKRFKPRNLLLIELLLTIGVTAVIAFSDFRTIESELRHDTADTQQDYAELTQRYISAYKGITIPVKDKLLERPSFDEMNAWLQAHEESFRAAVGEDVYDGLAITYQGGYAHSWNYGDYSAYDPATRPWYQEAQKADGEVAVVAPYVTYVGGSFPNSDQYMELSVVERYTDEFSFDLDLKIYGIDGLLKNRVFGYDGTQALLYDKDGYILSSTDRALYCHNIKTADEAVTKDLSAAAAALEHRPDRLRFFTIDGRIKAAYAREDSNGNTYCIIIPLVSILRQNFFSSTWIIPLLILAEIAFYQNYRNTVSDMNNRDAMIAALVRSAFQYQLTVDVKAMTCTPDARNRSLMPKDMNYQAAYALLRQRILKEAEQKQFDQIFSPGCLVRSEGKGLVRHLFTMDLRQEDGAAERRIMELGLLITRMNGRVYASILGNDVTDQEVEKRQVMESISDQYCVTAVVNLDTMQADVLKADPEFAGLLSKDRGLMEIQEEFAASYLKEEYAAQYREMMSPAQIRKSLEESGGFSITVQRKDGHWKTFRILPSVGFAQNRRFVFFAEDADEQMQHQQDLRDALSRANAATKAKNEFLSRMSHDIRTPMNGIIGMTYIAMEQKNSPRTEECLENISISSKFLLGLVNDILDMQKAESGAIQLHPEPYPLKEFNRYLNSVIKPLYTARHQEFINDVKPDMNILPLIDILRFNQIVFNLLSNAVKYTPNGGRILLQVRTSLLANSREEMQILVSDTGIGMSEEFQKVLFEPFVQGVRSDTSEHRGSGLGLAIVKKMVDLMGGTITVDSAPGKGTAFHVTLAFDCLAQSQDSWKPAGSVDSSDCSKLIGRQVLLCEDHPMNREIAETLLSEKRMIVHPAEDGRAGLDLFNASPLGFYDVILMDLRMPHMDGYEAVKAIRALPREDAPRIPIIAMSADAYEEDIRRCLACGMNAHIAKPFEPETLFRTISSLLKDQKSSGRS